MCVCHLCNKELLTYLNLYDLTSIVAKVLQLLALALGECHCRVDLLQLMSVFISNLMFFISLSKAN